MGSGKDFIARTFIVAYLKQYHPTLNIGFLAFADTLKIKVLEKYPELKWEDMYPSNNTPKTEYIRALLQKEGNIGRSKSPDYWIQSYHYWVKLMEQNGVDVLLTTDIRFELEKNHIQEMYNGLVCRVHASERTYKTQDSSLMKDISECSLDILPDDKWDYIFENNQPIECFSDAQKRFRVFTEILEKRL
jgi:hypothetical protein